MILDKVADNIKRYKLISKGDLVLIAVSGGPDSVALLYLLKDLSRSLGFKLQIAHLDHMLRRDSGKDADFVKFLARRLDIPIILHRINIKKLAIRGSLEEVARNARLEFLLKTAKSLHADKVALAHNLDDQAETLLMRILRGTGLYGLSGMLPKRIIYGFEVIRPLVNVTRREIEAYLAKKKIKARIDKSNLEDIYFRNKVRNKLIPLLERQYSPKIKEILSNTAVNIASDYDYLNKRALRLIKGKLENLNLTGLLKLHPSMLRLILRLRICRLQGSTRRITFKHIKEIEDLIYNRPVNSIVDLPKGISVIKKAKSIVFYRR